MRPTQILTKIIKILAPEAATGIYGMSVSPPVNTDRKGEVFPIMLQQFKRAIGASIGGTAGARL